MRKIDTRVIGVAVAPVGDSLYSEMVTTVMIVDESAGEFVEVIQSGRRDLGKIAINPEEWPALRAAIDTMIAECRPDAIGSEPQKPACPHTGHCHPGHCPCLDAKVAAHVESDSTGSAA